MVITRFEWPTIAGETAEDRFSRLAAEWKKESYFLSSISAKTKLASYQRIIGMGWAAVPLMLEDLKQEPHHWFVALRIITDVSPIPREDAGNMRKMADAWLKWGRENAIIEP